MSSRKSTRVVEEVVEKVDEGLRQKETATAGQHSSSRRAVDRSGRPSAVAADRSTDPVDRRAQYAQRSSGRPVRSTAEGEWSTVRSTD